MLRSLLLLYLVVVIFVDNSDAKSKTKKDKNKKPKERRCLRGDFLYKEEEHCLQRLGPMRHPQPCRDLTHIQGCKDFKCPPMYHKCPDSYCIEYHRLCDVFMDCPYGEDEKKEFCAKHKDPSRCEQHVDQGHELAGYRCKNEDKCVPRHQVCDNFRHCKDGGDEAFCVHCPEGCSCNALTYICKTRNHMTVPMNISHRARHVDLSYNKIQVLEDTLDFAYCGYLSFRDNEIQVITDNVFQKMINLHSLSLVNNKIEFLPKGLFSRTRNLMKLVLSGNKRLRSIEPNTFLLTGDFGGVQTLPDQLITKLNLTGLNIEELEDGVFNGLGNLVDLDLSHNNISGIHEDAFLRMENLQNLDVKGNPLLDTEGEVFANLSGLRTIQGDHFAFCCSIKTAQPSDCMIPKDVFSNCERLVSDETIRIFLWAYAGIGILGHIFMSIRELNQRKNSDAIGMMLRLNLSVSSYFLAVYCLIISGKDITNQGEYISSEWRRSSVCHFIGGVFRAAYMEIQITVMFSWVLARFIPQPKKYWKGKPPTTFVMVFIILSWLSCIGLSMPSKFISLEKRQPTQSSVCISLPNDFNELDQIVDFVSYSGVSVFLQIINVLTWIRYRWMNVAPAYQNLHDKTTNEVVEISTRPVEALVFTLVALPAYLASQRQLSDAIRRYVVLLGLPLPGQLRPLMTIWRTVFVKKHKKMGPGGASSIDKSQTLMSNADTIAAKAELTTGLLQDGKLGGFKMQGHFRKLQHVLDDGATTISYREIVHIVNKICKALDFMDNNGFRCADFSAEDIYLKDTGFEATFEKFRFEEVKLCLSKVQKCEDEYGDTSVGAQAIQCLGEIVQILISRC